MKMDYVILYVDNVAKAAEFYQQAFDLKIKFVHESNTYAEMVSGETTLAFADNELLFSNTGLVPLKGTNNCFEIAFSTSDVMQAFTKAVANGAVELAKPVSKPWGQTVAYVQDPFGTIVEICTPMA